jgi:hypothetical protein
VLGRELAVLEDVAEVSEALLHGFGLGCLERRSEGR